MAYSFFETITIDHTKCGSSDSTNFPFLFSGTYTNLATIANGGKVTSALGYDIIFASDSLGVSPLNFEMELYTAASGLVIFWVNIPTISHSADTVIYILYGNATITTFQGNINATWNSSYKVVTHYGNGITLSLTDSTSNGRNGTNVGTPGVTAVTGKIGGAGNPGAVIGGGNNYYATYSDTGLPNGSLDRSISMWVQAPFSAGLSSTGYNWSLGNFLTNHQGFSLSLPRSPSILYDGGTSYNITWTFSAATWYHVVATFTGGTLVVYVNGVAKLTTTITGLNTTLNGTLYTFQTNPAQFNTSSQNYIDEFRISNVALSADWILTEYNNQNSPSSFYTVGAPVGSGGLIINPGMTGHMKDLLGGVNG